MGRNARILITATAASTVFCATASADIVVDHQPHPFGGLGSDTSFTPDPSLPGVSWQRVADDFVLTEPAIIRQVNFWGFYNADNPPSSEEMRLRILGARMGDALPDESNVVREEMVQNPSRTWTGRLVATGIAPREYFFTTNLALELRLEASTAYWLEIVQVGAVDTRFRWEFSRADRNGQASINIIHDWRNTFPGVDSDTAFQLSTIPEPSTLILSAMAFCLTRRSTR